jgi:hypothetical protein
MGSVDEIIDVRAAARAASEVLGAYTHRNWEGTSAAELEWTCQKTVLHIVDCLYFYTMQIIYGNPTTYLCTELAPDDSATPQRMLDALTAHADLLHRIASTAAPDVRAHHNYGVSDAAGFAAMGAAETLLHTLDVVRGLNPVDPWPPPSDLSAQILARLFPQAPPGDPVDVLLYCCGRAPLGELPQLPGDWQWDSAVRP